LRRNRQLVVGDLSFSPKLDALTDFESGLSQEFRERLVRMLTHVNGDVDRTIDKAGLGPLSEYPLPALIRKAADQRVQGLMDSLSGILGGIAGNAGAQKGALDAVKTFLVKP